VDPIDAMTLTFDGPAGRLEALYRAGGERPARAAVVCHPHPQHGGTMHNKVVYRAAKAFESLGYAVLRFNFRGVGASEGSPGDGAGESEDVRAALDWLAAEDPGLPLVLAGFSFGNAVGLPVGAGDGRVTHLVGIGTPTDRFHFDALSKSTKPKLFVQGDRDEFGPLEALRAGLHAVALPWKLVVVEDADHFFTGRLAALQQAITDFFSPSENRP
jgi:alpha/beta superfamily hydrolase